MRKRQTKEQAAEARAGYHELAEQASEIAKKYLAGHHEADEGVVYGAATGAACMYHSKPKYRVQPFEVICLWWIRHRLLVKKGETNMPLPLQIILPILTFVLGAVLGLFICKKLVSKQLKDNPPINKDMIRAMYRSMGRTPTEANVNQTMRAIQDAQKKSRK